MSSPPLQLQALSRPVTAHGQFESTCIYMGILTCSAGGYMLEKGDIWWEKVKISNLLEKKYSGRVLFWNLNQAGQTQDNKETISILKLHQIMSIP